MLRQSLWGGFPTPKDFKVGLLHESNPSLDLKNEKIIS